MNLPFERVLIANRGEIACRIVRACQSLGLQAIAVYSEADREAPHVRLADQAFLLGPAPPAASYLNLPALLELAQRAGAEALHPGYGFLAERPELAQACLEAGITWIGPSPEILSRLGAKTAARDLAKSLGIPVIPGVEAESTANWALQAEALGYPLLIKAVGGGGGRGMRQVLRREELIPACEAASREALQAFGDARIYFEKLLQPVRHIEFQILGDARGQVLYLGERECSLQRRYQKILEEAPAPGLSQSLRAQMGAAAVRLAQALHYQGAGTVEFLLDSAEQFYFLEVNPRIQVEHPVTEAITGIDLVAWQIRLAAGESLPWQQENLPSTGHALEVRICAEAPERGFLPESGLLGFWQTPEGVRCDTWVETGTRISGWYDSLLAKLIVTGNDRAAALRQLRRALRQTQALGISTNLNLLRRLAEAPDLAAGRVHTQWLESQNTAILTTALPPAALAAATLWLITQRSPDPLRQRGLPLGWRLLPDAWQQDCWRWQGQTLPVRYRACAPHSYEWCGAEQTGLLRWLASEAETLVLEFQDQRYAVRTCAQGSELWLGHPDWGELCFEILPRLSGGRQNATSSGEFLAPVPARVLRVAVSPGQEVSAGQPLLILESMKMETTLSAPGPGRVEQILVQPGEQVSRGQELLIFQPLNPAG